MPVLPRVNFVEKSHDAATTVVITNSVRSRYRISSFYPTKKKAARRRVVS